ncbi:hypothetical protein ACFFHJ_13745 [Planotetraspora thailandica]|uniref:hypothetical protein n=1 Tax=Planotetraspora thailandica TaxID=487172 RepID=UPI00194E8EC9|nr:hypothetical protein [Planotetraspora thailandica]
MITLRSLASAAVIVPLATMSVLVAGATSASADGGTIVSPKPGAVISTSGPVTVSAKIQLLQLSMGLYVEGPSVSLRRIAQGGLLKQPISGSFDPGAAPNGVFTVSLRGQITKKTYTTSTFTLSRPPAAPTGVEAGLKGADVVVTWPKGTEPDLRSYEVSSPAASGSFPVATACSGSTCQASLAVPSQATAQRVGFSVRAVRSDGLGGTLTSGDSAAAYVSVPAAPQPTHSATSASPSPSERHADPTTTAGSGATPQALPRLTTDGSKTTLTLPDISDDDAAVPEVAPPGSAEWTAGDDLGEESSGSFLGGPAYGIALALAGLLVLLGSRIRGWMKRREAHGGVALTPVAALTAAGGSGGTAKAAVAALPPASPRRPAELEATTAPGSTPGTPSSAPGRTVRGTASTIARRPSIVLAGSPDPDPERSRTSAQTGAAGTPDDDDPYTGRRRR